MLSKWSLETKLDRLNVVWYIVSLTDEGMGEERTANIEEESEETMEENGEDETNVVAEEEVMAVDDDASTDQLIEEQQAETSTAEQQEPEAETSTTEQQKPEAEASTSNELEAEASTSALQEPEAETEAVQEPEAAVKEEEMPAEEKGVGEDVVEIADENPKKEEAEDVAGKFTSIILMKLIFFVFRYFVYITGSRVSISRSKLIVLRKHVSWDWLTPKGPWTSKGPPESAPSECLNYLILDWLA